MPDWAESPKNTGDTLRYHCCLQNFQPGLCGVRGPWDTLWSGIWGVHGSSWGRELSGVHGGIVGSTGHSGLGVPDVRDSVGSTGALWGPWGTLWSGVCGMHGTPLN